MNSTLRHGALLSLILAILFATLYSSNTDSAMSQPVGSDGKTFKGAIGLQLYSLRDQFNTLSQKLRNILMVPGLPTLHAQRHRHRTHHNRRVHVWPKLHTTFSARSQETKSGAFRAMRNNAYRLHIF